MNKLTLALALGGAIALAPPVVRANTYFDVDSLFGTPALTSGGPAVTTTFGFITSDGNPPPNQVGFNPATETVVSINLQIAIDQATVPSKVHIDLDGVGLDIPSTDPSITIGPSLFSSAQLTALAAAAQDGSVLLSITSLQGSFNAENARMDITTEPKRKGVPDGGSTVALLGFAVCGLGWAKRKFSR